MLVQRLIRLSCLVTTLAALLCAQDFRATITGRVVDSSGSVVANAKVAVTDPQTNEVFTANTGAEGTYTIPLLKPGKYTIAAEAAGFKKALREGIELSVGDKRTVDFTLDIGQTQESVTVTAAPPMLDEATATRGGVIENLRITEMPLNGRNPFMLATLSPGVQFNGNPQFIRPFDNGDNANFSINGGVRQSNAYLIDGAPNDAATDPAADRSRANANVAYIPTVDSTQEFKIVTNFYDAQYGRTGGGVITVSTKSGSNEYHGTVYDFMRRYQWDANNTVANAQGRPIYAVEPGTGKNLGGHKLDQYGAFLSGPVLLPKLYNGKDKTFFSFGYENYRESSPSPGLASVPTALERQGDFSQDGLTIFDPFSTRLNPAFDSTKGASLSNPQFIRTQFPNNVIPKSQTNAVGFALANAYPMPNYGAANARTNNYLSSPNLSLDKFKNVLARVDRNIGQMERLFFRYAYNKREQFDQGTVNFPGLGFDAQDPLVRENHNAVADSVTVLSPNMILDVRLGLTRYMEAAYRQHVYGADLSSLGFPQSFLNARPDPIPPYLNVEQFQSWGTRNQRYMISNTISLQPSVSWNKGRHSLHFGADLRDRRINPSSASTLRGGGQFDFNRDTTTQFPGIQQTGSGSAVASLLLGAPYQGLIQSSPRLAYRNGYYGLFLQDDIRVTSRLTVNVGLRYDIEGSPTERYNRMNAGWSFNAAEATLANAAKTANASDCPACANLAGGLLFAGVNGNSRSAFSTDYNHWQPRIGAAYRLRQNTVLRGGYGLFYLPEAFFGGVQGFAADTPFVATAGGGANAYIPANTLSNPFPGGINQPTGSSLGLATFAGNNVIFTNPNLKIPYISQYSFGVQHQLPFNVKIDASYVGSRSYNLNTGANQLGNARNINVNTAAQIAQARLTPAYFTDAVKNPFAGLLPGTSFNGATVARSQLLKPFPQFNQVLEYGESIGKSWYDAFQLSVEKRYTQGLVMVLAYTWSKNLESVDFLNPQDAGPAKTYTAVDRPQRLVLSGVYELPFGRGKKYLSGVNRGLNMLAAGWEYTFIGTIQSGTPVNLPSNVDLIANPSVSNQTFASWFNNCVANTSGFASCGNPAFQLRGPNTLRTIPFRIGAIRNPVRPQWDMSLNKRVYISERFNVQARLEAFNVLNTPVRSGPGTDPTNLSTFGIVTLSQSNIPRQVQLGLKFNF
ncbi:MAG: TonB-dependent receptor [Bryobacterales bacterium]|nr:TonB-dependent receptor [Bryobacterales bacterium]